MNFGRYPSAIIILGIEKSSISVRPILFQTLSMRNEEKKSFQRLGKFVSQSSEINIRTTYKREQKV